MWRLSHMYIGQSGSYTPRQLRQVTIETFLNRVQPVMLPFLPPLPEYTTGRQVVLNEHNIDMVINGNAHLFSEDDLFELSVLHPALSVLNHDDNKNCHVVHSESLPSDWATQSEPFCCKLSTGRAIAANEELTVSYFNERPEGLKKKGAKF
eukprot:Selendium_serpulae@DN4996_c0_g1_i1.p1